MPTDSESLLRILRCELAAINQQFMHILALREWGETEAAARITQVDNADFPNAMRIIDYLIGTGTRIRLEAGDFVPGTDYGSILISEQTMEQRLSAAIEKADCSHERAQRLVKAAKKPRKAYSAWLSDRLDENAVDSGGQLRVGTETADIVAHLISLIEQSMVHAFMHWHARDVEGADAAWATSGAAMMHMTKFIRLFAAYPSIPVPGACPTPRIAHHTGDALDCDRELALFCSNKAAVAAGRCDQEAVADLCGEIADYSLKLSRWSPEQAHPAASTNPAAFGSFEATLSKFVPSQ